MTILKLEPSQSDTQLRSLFLSAPCLKELHIQSGASDHLEVNSAFANVVLPHLDVLSCWYTNFTGNSFADALQMGNLIKLRVCSSDAIGNMLAIARHCPLLRSLGLSGCVLDDTSITEIARSCSHIVYLDIQNIDITDVGMGAVTTYLFGLRSLNIRYCTELTSTSLVHIYANCANTLHILYLSMDSVDGPQFEYNALNDLFAHCTQLRTLYLSQYGMYAPVYTLPPSMHNVTTLALNDDAVCDENLLLVSQYCKQLTTLSLTSMWKVRLVLSVDTLTAVVVGCSALRHLYYSDILLHCGFCFGSASHLSLLQNINPRLSITQKGEFEFDILAMPV